MKTMRGVACAALVLGVCVCAGVRPAVADVVDFDDLVLNASGVLNVPDGYRGFLWGPTPGNPRFYAFGNAPYMGAGNYNNNYGAPSGTTAASNYAGLVTLSRLDGGAFDFVGAMFSTFATNSAFVSRSATSLTVRGMAGTTEVGAATITFAAPPAYGWLAAGFTGVTALVFEGAYDSGPDSSANWMMDDFTYRLSPVGQPVPEPGTLGLLVAGAALATARRITRQRR